MKFSGNEFRKLAAAVRADWHLGCTPPRPDWSVERELFRSGIAEILSLRLRVAYTPLLQGLQRIEDRVSILTEIRAEPYAPPARHSKFDKPHRVLGASEATIAKAKRCRR